MMKTVSLGGVEIPVLGLGTWQVKDEACTDVVRAALESGWTHIDTAARYENEKAVGKGLRAASAARDSYFLTSKVWHDQLEPEKLIQACEDSLDRLGLEHLDLYLIHWPNPRVPLKEQIEALLEVKARGWTRAVGVSNFTSDLVREAQDLADGQLALNQVEYHPFLSQEKVRAALDAAGLGLTAYAPLARGAVAEDETIRDIAKRHGKSAAQVGLRWLVQQDNTLAIPKTSNPERLAENAAIFDFELSEAEMTALNALGGERRRTIDPDFAPDWDDA